MKAAPNLPRRRSVDQRPRGLEDVGRHAPILGALLDGQKRAVAAVEAAIPALSKAAELVAGMRCRAAGG